jgi:hypothetical protein
VSRDDYTPDDITCQVARTSVQWHLYASWRRTKLAAKAADLEANTPYGSSSAFADAAGAGGMKDPDYQFPEVHGNPDLLHQCVHTALPAGKHCG